MSSDGPNQHLSDTLPTAVFVAAAFPDDFGDTPLIQKHRIAKVWEEMEATTSEASVLLLLLG